MSFAIRCAPPAAVLSLTLLRTPEFEFALDDAERGVHVSNETDDDDGEYLLELETRGRTAEIRTNRHHYNLDLAQVEEKEIQNMKRVLEAMNFDQRFLLKFDIP